MATHTLMTAEQFDQLPTDDGRKLELIDGELIEVASATAEHNQIEGNLLFSLKAYLRTGPGGTVLPDTEFAMAGEHRLRPDLSVLKREKWAGIDPRRVPLTVPPDIAIEIVSPSESAFDLDRKVSVYLQGGVAEAWIVYPETRHVHIHAANSLRNVTGVSALETELLPGWSMPLAELFAL